MLSILIPTYNRSEFLLKNLLILNDILNESGNSDKITILISNNCSPDDTRKVVDDFKRDHNLRISYFEQAKNLGPIPNILFVLEQSSDKYVMYIGDDDYISYEYFNECLDILKNDNDAYAIIPNFIPISVDDQIIGLPRDKMESVRMYKAGFKSLIYNSYRGHQLSGLVFKREGLLDSYFKNGVNNLYLFIYFTGIWCLKGNVYRITNLPVKVTQPIKKKDWGYGDDGLINEVFDNYKRLPVNYFQRFLLEMYFMNKNIWRLTMYKSTGTKLYRKAFCKITFAKNATIIFSFLFPFYFITRMMLSKIKRFIKK